MPESDRPTYRVDLQALADDCPAEVRLRQFLKRAVRAYRLKCVRVEQLQPGPIAEAAQAEAQDLEG
jgi:hypothetical protein